ncbi:MAG: NosD domain-containing protein, partial [Thermofilaceae archaeon]
MPVQGNLSVLPMLCTRLTIAVLLASVLLPVTELQKVQSWAIRIKPDGSVEPLGAPIAREGNVYTLLADLNVAGDGVIVEKSGVVLNGNGHLLKGNGTGTGIHLKGVTSVVVKDLRVDGFRYGLSINKSVGISLVNVSATLSRVGVGIINSSDILVEASIFQNCMVGVFVEESFRCRLLNNFFKECGLYVRSSFGNVVEGNVVNGKPLVYLEGAQGGNVSGEVGQVVLVQCRNITVSAEVSAATVGVLVSECEQSKIIGLNVTSCVIGVDLWRTSSCVIDAGSFKGNEVGLRLVESRNNLVANSQFTGNAHGVYAERSNGNVVRDCLVGDSTIAGIRLVNSS